MRNDTPEGPHVSDIAFAGAGKTYRIDDTVEIDVTFSEAVTVTGRPTLVLDVGGNSRKAGYVSGSGSAVLRFEYTVAAGDLDTDGLAVKASGLETPSGVSIVTVAIAEAVILRHGSFADPAHKVDGVLPTADAAVGRGADGDGDLVGGAGRGIGTRGRGRVHGAHRQCRTVRR